MVEKYDLIVYNLLPLFGLLFHPKSETRTLLPKYPLEFCAELEILAYRCLLIHLEIVLSQQSVRDELKFKDTDQHIVCFPWGLPPSLRPHAEHLSSFVHSFKPLPVPKLSIIVRAHCVRLYLEIDKMKKEKIGQGLDGEAFSKIASAGLPVMAKDQQVYVIAIN